MRLRSVHLFGLLLILLVGPAGSLSAQPGAPPRKFALLVGVNEYQHDKLPNLKYAENDVVELAQLLRQHGYQVILLCDAEGRKDEARAPTRANIEKHLKGLLAQCRKGDAMLVAFAGHGLQFEKEGQKEPADAYFCPSDAKPFADQTATLISLRDVYRELERSFAGPKVLLVDACRNDPKKPRGVRGIGGNRSPRPPDGVAALFSCKAGEVAWEPDQLKHGVFFHHVLEGLRGKARNNKGNVTFSSLMDYVMEEVPATVEKLVGDGATQSPTLTVSDSSAPRFVLIARATSDTKPGTIVTNKQGMKFAWIPPGTFTMGSPPGEKDRFENEVPHKVTLTRGFYMGIYPVTQKQWQEVMGDNPSHFKKEDNYPVERVSWEDCQKFVQKLSDREGKEYRLPTEAEWEYGCRAGTTTAYYTGDDEDALNRAGWYWKNKGSRTNPVGRKEPNKWGLYDMHGNVYQWCEDWYGDYANGDITDPKGSNNGIYRVLRGGAWRRSPRFCRAAYRNFCGPGERSCDDIGLRVCFRLD